MSTTVPVIYRWPRVRVIRAAGSVFVVLGASWLVIALVHVRLDGSRSALSVAALLVTAIVMAVTVTLLVRPPKVLTLAADGYRIHHLRGGGVTSANWVDVKEVTTRGSREGQLIVVDLGDGGHSVVPVALLGRRALEAQRQIHELLNTAYGYRRLDL
ncbi:MAG: hypothetical protein ABJA81_10770 [Nocardioidaceae bacterium]